MNIFLLDYDHETCARYHCDKHVVKMPLETTQMLCTVNWRYNQEAPYKPVHQKHPCTLWAGETVNNYRWLWKLGISLCKEYTFRYNRVHACEKILAIVKDPPVELTNTGLTKFAQAMPDEYKNADVIKAYHQYYNGEKKRLAVWKKRKTPPFMIIPTLSSSEIAARFARKKLILCFVPYVGLLIFIYSLKNAMESVALIVGVESKDTGVRGIKKIK